MTDRPVDEIRPGDRVYLSEGQFKGDIVRVTDARDNGMAVTRGGRWTTLHADKPLRILQPCDVIPAGATRAFVQSDGSLGGIHTQNHSFTVCGGHAVILSMPTPEPSREEQRAKLVEAQVESLRVVRSTIMDWRAGLINHRDLVDAVRVFGEALDALEKFDAEDARTNRRYQEDE